ncbi:hypothetical protein L249_3066, partial [Ophiocordyceps polyrhachis-furcata BCC 54312]
FIENKDAYQTPPKRSTRVGVWLHHYTTSGKHRGVTCMCSYVCSMFVVCLQTGGCHVVECLIMIVYVRRRRTHVRRAASTTEIKHVTVIIMTVDGQSSSHCRLGIDLISSLLSPLARGEDLDTTLCVFYPSIRPLPLPCSPSLSFT